METIKLKKGISLEMYDSIEEMPIVAFQEYNRSILIDSGIGADLDSFDMHIDNVRRSIAAGDMVKAEQILVNMRQNINFIIQNVSPKHRAFSSLVKSINGKEVGSTEEVMGAISEIEVGVIARFLNSLKKKLKLK